MRSRACLLVLACGLVNPLPFPAPAECVDYGGYLRWVGAADLKGTANYAAIALSGHYAYVAYGPGDLQVVDLHPPRAPQLVGKLTVPGEARDVAVSGDYAYVTFGSAGLHVVNISDPSRPRVEGIVGTGMARAWPCPATLPTSRPVIWW